MNTINVLLLICSSLLSNADCQVDTAELVIQGPSAKSSYECAMVGQTYLAGSAIQIGRDQWLKIVCSREWVPEDVG